MLVTIKKGQVNKGILFLQLKTIYTDLNQWNVHLFKLAAPFQIHFSKSMQATWITTHKSMQATWIITHVTKRISQARQQSYGKVQSFQIMQLNSITSLCVMLRWTLALCTNQQKMTKPCCLELEPNFHSLFLLQKTYTS